MPRLCLVLLLFALGWPALAQPTRPCHYAVWADALLNAQLAKSSHYFLGTGLRAEASRPLANPTRAVFAQLGYGHFFRKPTSAFTADVALLNVGYRYQSRRSFGVALGVGAQYWHEQLRVQLADALLAETLHSLRPSATVSFSFRLPAHCLLGAEYRLLLQPEAEAVQLYNNVALAVGYAF